MKRNLHRFIALALVFSLLAGCAAGGGSSEETAGLSEAGETHSGFTVREIIPMDALGATGVVYSHDKSGATLLYLASEDANRSFDITFRTPALDEKGKPHVFEHITISGTQRYPDANMFFPIASQTYKTFMNAYTYHGMTSFPLASLSEKQLMTMMDYYLSGVFEPLLYTEPRLAQREAWRYELTDADADLNITGTVYSEMQGALTLPAQAEDNNLRTLYKGSATAHQCGGVPDAVRTLTYEELVEFHDTYYHPSNALITLYGDLDINRFLEYIDSEYLSKYDKKEITVDMGVIAPATKTTYAEYEVAVESGAATEKASEIYYSFALNGAGLSEHFYSKILLNVMLQESSPVMIALRKKLPDAQVSGCVDIDSPSAPFFGFKASGVDPEDRDIFVAAVDEGLAALAAEGVSAEALDSVLSASKLSLLTAQEDVNLGVNASLNIALGWVYFGTVDYYSVYKSTLLGVTKASADAFLKQYATGNPHRAVSVTKPVAGLTEQKAAALASELADKKAAMTPEEIDALVASSAEFIEWANTPASEELIAKVANVKVAELPEERRKYEVSDETVDGVRYMSAVADVPGVYMGSIMLDGGSIPVEILQDAQAALSMLGQLDTETHSKEELSTLTMRYLPGLSTSLEVITGYSGSGRTSAHIGFTGLADDAEASTALLKEILFETDYSDAATIKSLLTRWNSDFASKIDNSSLNIQLSRCSAMFNDYSAYGEYVSNYDMLVHCEELIALAESDPAALTARMDAALAFVLNRSGAVVLSAGSEDAIAAYSDGMKSIIGAMTDEQRKAVDYSVLRIPARNEGVVTNSTVQMNMVYNGYDGYSGSDNVSNRLIDDSFMLPQLRSALGAYGAYSYLERGGCYLFTYRDPNLAGSYEIFAKLPKYLRTVELTQESVDSYIRGSYSGLSRPLGLLSGAQQAMTDRLVGYEADARLQWMKQAKETTVEDVRATADVWDAMLQNGVRSTSGTESALLAASDMFDVLIYPDGTVKELSGASA